VGRKGDPLAHAESAPSIEKQTRVSAPSRSTVFGVSLRRRSRSREPNSTAAVGAAIPATATRAPPPKREALALGSRIRWL
jgi:hypothetical protein